MRRFFQFATAVRSRSAPAADPPRSAPAADEPRAVPRARARHAVYIYGIARRDGMVESAAPFVEGVIPGVPVEILPAGGYAVIVSRAPSRLFLTSPEGQSHAAGRVAAHHRALINLAMFAEIVPVKAGFVLPDSNAVLDWLAHVATSIVRALKRAGGAQEWCVRMFADMECCARVPVSNPAIAALEAGLQNATPAKAATIRKRLLDERGREVLRGLTECAGSVHRGLLGRARAGLAHPVTLGGAWDGIEPILVLDSAYLVTRGNEAALNRYAAELTNILHGEGFTLELSGPWPPYSFSKIELKTPDSVST